MKKIIFTVIFIGAALGAVYLLSAPGNTAAAENTNAPVKQQYTCGMHPEIISDEPGYCPICGMKLTPKKDGAASSGSVTIDPVTTQNMGLKTVPAGYHTLSRAVRAFGKVTYREPNLYTVNLKINGWVEKLYVDYKGEQVSKGQPLLEIYSPELVAAQKEYLIAYKASMNNTEAAGNMRSLLEAARQRLLNWDISNDQLEQLEETGEVTRTMRISSPADGVVVVKKVSEGENLKAGAELYRVADLSSVWVVANVYEQDLPWVSLGQEATVVLPHLPGEKFTAAVSYVSPYLDENRQAEARLELNNPRALLKPGMYAEVTLHSVLSGDRLAAPRTAVIHSGVRELVYVATGEGAYEPRLITSGVVGEDDMVEVKSGLAAGEKVVVSGQFLLDSESRLSEAIGMDMSQHDHGGTVSLSEKKVQPTEEMPPAAMTGHEEHELSGIYTCPMPVHYHVLQYGEGTCPECGMKLVPVEETDNTGFYVCPMTEDRIVQKEPGRCSVCGMKLVKFEKDAGHDK